MRDINKVSNDHGCVPWGSVMSQNTKIWKKTLQAYQVKYILYLGILKNRFGSIQNLGEIVEMGLNITQLFLRKVLRSYPAAPNMFGIVWDIGPSRHKN